MHRRPLFAAAPRHSQRRSAYISNLPQPPDCGSKREEQGIRERPFHQSPPNNQGAAAKENGRASGSAPIFRNCRICLNGPSLQISTRPNPRKRRRERSGRSPECRRQSLFLLHHQKAHSLFPLQEKENGGFEAAAFAALPRTPEGRLTALPARDLAKAAGLPRPPPAPRDGAHIHPPRAMTPSIRRYSSRVMIPFSSRYRLKYRSHAVRMSLCDGIILPPFPVSMPGFRLGNPPCPSSHCFCLSGKKDILWGEQFFRRFPWTFTPRGRS